MMTLTLNDGTQFEVYDVVNPYELSMTTDTATMKQAVEKITTDNLKHATVGDEVLTNKILVGIQVSPINETTEEVTITFNLGEKSEMDIINERLDEQDAALMELAELIVG